MCIGPGSLSFGNDEQAWCRYLGIPPMVHCDVEDSLSRVLLVRAGVSCLPFFFVFGVSSTHAMVTGRIKHCFLANN